MKTHSKFFTSRLKLPLAILTALSISMNVHGQKFAVKVYQNTDLFSARSLNKGRTTDDWTLNFNRISLAFDINSRNDITHEVEIFIPEYSRKLENVGFPYGYHLSSSLSAANRESNFALRYEVNKKITKGKGPFTARIGLAVNPYYLQIQYTPTSEGTYSTSLKNYGASFNVVPGLAYALSKNFQLTLNIPLKVYDFTYEVEVIRNPSIPIRQQETRSYEHIFFEKVFTMRFGVAYAFGK